MAGELIRILSDIHFGDRASRVRRLEQVRPLTTGVDAVVFNGDTLDTRFGPRPHYTKARREELNALIAGCDAEVSLLTGNHDPDISTSHSLDLASGEVFVVHGDVLFEEIVPWGRDARTIRRKITAMIGGAPATANLTLEQRLNIWRAAAVSVPQRHQSETRRLHYALHFAVDTVWPPTRFFRIIQAWQVEPARAAQLARQHRPRAKYVILGHTHRPSIRSLPGGPVVINTGSFCRPFGGFVVDLGPRTLTVRRTEPRGHDFHAGAVVAEFPLSGA